MKNIMEQFGHGILAACVGLLVLSLVGWMGWKGALFDSVLTKEPDISPMMNAMYRIAAEDPPAIEVQGAEAENLYPAEALLCQSQGSLRVLSVKKDGQDVSDTVLSMEEQTLSFPTEGIYVLKCTSIGVSGGEKTGYYYIRVGKKGNAA